MIVLVLTTAQATAIRDALPEGALKTQIARDVAAERIPTTGLPELVIARPRWEYVECIPDRATADRCWAALVRAFRGKPAAPRGSGRRRSGRARRVGALRAGTDRRRPE